MHDINSSASDSKWNKTAIKQQYNCKYKIFMIRPSLKTIYDFWLELVAYLNSPVSATKILNFQGHGQECRLVHRLVASCQTNKDMPIPQQMIDQDC